MSLLGASVDLRGWPGLGQGGSHRDCCAPTELAITRAEVEGRQRIGATGDHRLGETRALHEPTEQGRPDSRGHRRDGGDGMPKHGCASRQGRIGCRGFALRASPPRVGAHRRHRRVHLGALWRSGREIGVAHAVVELGPPVGGACIQAGVERQFRPSSNSRATRFQLKVIGENSDERLRVGALLQGLQGRDVLLALWPKHAGISGAFLRLRELLQRRLFGFQVGVGLVDVVELGGRDPPLHGGLAHRVGLRLVDFVQDVGCRPRPASKDCWTRPRRAL